MEAIVRGAEEPGLTLVTLGPLTNIALALARDPGSPDGIGRCVVMGGAPCCEGNVTPAAEYNIWVDPEAARAVFRSKLPIEMVGWHVSRGASVLERRRDRGDRGARHGEGAIRHGIGTAAPARPTASRPGRSACRSPIRPRWRSRSTARSACPGRAIGWRSRRESELTRGMTVVDRLKVSTPMRSTPRSGARPPARATAPTCYGRSELGRGSRRC